MRLSSIFYLVLMIMVRLLSVVNRVVNIVERSKIMFNIRVKYKDEVKSRVTATVGEYSNYLENMLHVMKQNANIDWVRIERVS